MRRTIFSYILSERKADFILYSGDDPDCFYLPLWIKILQNISLLCLILNSSTNFFIYCVFNSSFRAELLSKLGKKPKQTTTRYVNQILFTIL